MNEQEAQRLAEDLRLYAAENNYAVMGVEQLGDGTFAVRIREVAGESFVSITPAPRDRVALPRTQASQILAAYNKLQHALPLQQFLDIVQAVRAQYPDATLPDIAENINMFVPETENPQKLTNFILSYLSRARDRRSRV